ncbi:hypothetical protein RUND412_005483 [Rhizina undulata]
MQIEEPMSKPPNNGPAPPTTSADGGWNDEKLVEALRRLDDLHRKLINMRNVIPSIIEPLTSNYSNPADMFSDLSERAISSSEQIATFNTLWTASKPIFDHADASRNQNPRGINRLAVQEVFLPKSEEEKTAEEIHVEEDAEMKDANEEVEEDEEAIETPEEEVEGIIEEFKKSVEGIEVELVKEEDGAKKLIRMTLLSPMFLRFEIDIQSPSSASDSSNISKRYIVTSVANSENPNAAPPHLYTHLLRSIAAHQSTGNLRLILEMLATYVTIFSTRCEKCGSLTAGSKAELPVVRKRVKDTVSTNGTGDMGTIKVPKRWAAFHEVCI